jgi:c-di-GMP-binding flagellar brake protein YcgR
VSTEGERTHRRRFARANVDFPVTIIVPGHELVLEGSAVDLSAGGMRVASVSDLPAGQSVMLRFALREGGQEMLVRGKVVMSFFEGAKKRYAHGVAFTQYAQPDQDAIVAFVESTGAEKD